MNKFQKRQALRLAIVAELARRGGGNFGRTAIMKLIYFLQVIKGIPLGYSFRLYTYGPYDSQVIEDLEVAEALGIVRSKSVQWSGGSGYAIAAGEKSETAINRVRDEVSPLQGALDWVVAEFGQCSAIDLEIAATSIFVDKSSSLAGQTISVADLVSRVHAIKPHHQESRIRAEVEKLLEKRLLSAVRLAA